MVAPDLAQLPQGTRRIVECGDAEANYLGRVEETTVDGELRVDAPMQRAGTR